MFRSALLTLVLAWGALLSGAPAAAAECYTILVGRDASADGSVLIGHNEDDAGDIVVNLRRVPARTYAARPPVILDGGARHDAGPRVNGFLWIEATTQTFADVFVTDSGVAMVSNSCPSREQDDDFTQGGIAYLLRRLVAEQAVSARDAVRLAGELVAQYGYTGSGRTYCFADRREGWLFCVVRGRHWAARRVPDDQVVVIPNRFVIHEVDFADDRNFAASPGLVDYATRRGWYDPATDGAFDFARAFNALRDGPVLQDGNTLRHWRGLALLGNRAFDVQDRLPFCVAPGRKLEPADLMLVLRDHYEGTPHDVTAGYREGSPNHTRLRTICTDATIHATVVRLHEALPEPLSILVYLSLGRPDTAPFLPFYPLAGDLPEGLGLGDPRHDDARFTREHFQDGAFEDGRDGLLITRAVATQRAVEQDYGKLAPRVRAVLDPLERALQLGLPALQQAYRDLAARDPDAARTHLLAFNHGSFALARRAYGEIDAILGAADEGSH
ncbi:MAG: C69 family dipeptidase [Candidatus Latescibacteria bacterium]|nr:C69 family dipeptidase [Candidatus Latescibacterota bacterium]